MPENQSRSLTALQQLAHQFASRHLDNYTAELNQPDYLFTRKEVNDALWGTVGLTGPEVALLDSPLLQRLRYIRQLGVIHWVYPGAVHTRFEHTLGVLHQVQHLVTALNAIGVQNGGGQLISANQLQLLRMAAIMHDIGHAAFSHVSELAIKSLPDLTLLCSEFSNARGLEDKQLSEIFAYYVVRSPAVKVFFEVVIARCGAFISLEDDSARNIAAIVEKVSNAIIGQRIDDKIPQLHEIISGPFDADKLDYFVRDAQLAGTPTVIDISRLVQKLTVRALDMHELPEEVAKTVRQIDSKYYLFGVKWSGVAVLDELHLARVLLFAKIYRHPKVIAIEQMLRAVFRTLAPLVSVDTLLHFLYQNTDDTLLGMDKGHLALSLGLDLLDAEIESQLNYVAELLSAIRYRRLWVRAYQVQRRYPVDPLERDTAQREGLIEFLEQLEHIQNREKFVTVLLDDVHRVLTMLGNRKYSRRQLDSLVMVHTLGPTPGGTQIARAYLISSTGRPLPFREYTVNRTAWADGYLSDQPKGYFYCPAEIADAVFISIEKLIRTLHNVRLPPSAMEASKRDEGRVRQLKKRLSELQYYRDAPFDIRPASERLQMADVPGKVDAFETILAAYQEPVTEPKKGNVQSPANRTMLWLRQFDDDKHVDCALKLLQNFRMIGRKETVNALRTFIDANPAFKGCWVVPLGSLKDSGSVQTYYAVDLPSDYVAKCGTLDEVATAAAGAPVVFVDDFVATGSQAEDILASGFGQINLKKPLGEERSMFSNATQDYLKSNKVAFVLTAAWDEGIHAIVQMCKKMELDASVFRLLDETHIPFIETCLAGTDAAVLDSFMTRCREIGVELLQSTESGVTGRGTDLEQTAKREGRALGYGNRGMLLATSINVPAQTLTAIWSTGKVSNVEWYPLMLRRKKA